MPHAQSQSQSLRHDPRPVLITGARRSLDEEFTARRRRYSLIMAMRIPCLVVAGVLAIGFGLPIAAAVLVVASVPLPWIAVLIANDGPPRRSEAVARPAATMPTIGPVERPALEAPLVIDAPAPPDDTTHRAA